MEKCGIACGGQAAIYAVFQQLDLAKSLSVAL